MAKKSSKGTSKKKSTKKSSKSKKPKTNSRKSAKKSVKASAKRSKKQTDNASDLRTSSRERVYNLTKEVPDHEYFILANGKPVKHVAELASILDQLEDHVFGHHVTPDRNDFHNWVKDIFDDVELARKIVGVNDKKHMQLVIYRHLAGHE